ncbi:hypothetical protein SALBM217S_09928 [Streptomyces griseoloalbus]
MRLLPGTEEFLAGLPAERWAVVTSATRRLAEARLAAVGILPKTLIAADDITRGKPDPEPYLLAARTLGVDPADCVGVLLVTDRGGLLKNVVVNKVIGQIVNIGRSMPFIILMVALMSFTRWVTTGTTIGSEAAIVPLAIGGIPFFARLVETAVREVDGGLVEAVQSMGGNTWTIVRKVLVPESLPSLIASTTTTIIALIGYSAMAGTVGGGGLGDLAVRYGYQRFDPGFMWITVALLAVAISCHPVRRR